MRKNSFTGIFCFYGLLAGTIISLKLTGHIDWSWVWVLAPIWIPAGLFVVIIFVALLSMVLHMVNKRYGR